MSTIDKFSFPKALGLGFGLSAINPKNLAMCAAAGMALGTSSIDSGQKAIAFLVFTLLAACTVVIPVIAYAIASDKMRHPLDRLKNWLQENNSAVMTVLLLIIGVVLIGKGLQ